MFPPEKGFEGKRVSPLHCPRRDAGSLREEEYQPGDSRQCGKQTVITDSACSQTSDGGTGQKCIY